MAVYKLPLLLTPQPEGGFVVTCPLLPELITEGETIQQAIHNANDALEAVIEAFEDLGRPLPPVHAVVRQLGLDRNDFQSSSQVPGSPPGVCYLQRH